MKEKKPDKRSAEKMSSDLAKLLGGQKFKDKKDVQVFLDSIMKGGMVPGRLKQPLSAHRRLCMMPVGVG